MAYTDEVLADSPVGFWLLDEASGDFADSSGNGNDAVVSEPGTAADYGVTGPIDGHTAVHFNGGTYAQIASAAALHPAGGTNPWSVEAWVKGDSGHGDFGSPAFITPAYSGTYVDWILGMWTGSGQDNQPSVNFYQGGWQNLHDTGTSLSDDTWHHIVGTFDGSDLRLYFDGALLDGPFTPSNTPLATSNDVYIACRWDSTATRLTYMAMSGLALYDTALSATRVQAHYEAAQSRLLTSDWETNTANDGGVWDLQSNAVQSTNPRHGTYNGDDGANSGFKGTLAEAVHEFYAGFGIKWDAGPGARRFVTFNSPNDTVQVSLAIDGSGHIRAGRGDLYQFGGGTELGVGSTALTSGTYYYVEVHVVIDDTAGVFEVKLDDSTEISLTAQDTKNDGSSALVDRVYIGSDGFSERHYWDDVYVNSAIGGYETSSFGGVPAITATAAQTLPSVTQSASGGPTIDADAAQTLPSVVQSASATVAAITADLAQTLPSVTQDAAADVVNTAAIVQTLPSVTQAASGGLVTDATVETSLPRFHSRTRAYNAAAGTPGPDESFVAGSMTLDIQDPNGASTVVSAAPFQAARITWTSDGPGAAEVDVLPSQLTDDWQAGTHRIILKFGGGPIFAGYITRLARDGSPAHELYKVSAVGLQSILDWRLVRHAYEITDTLDGIVFSLLDEAQAQFNGDMGFTHGAVWGTLPTRTRGYCFGIVIGDEIRDLAAVGKGFDWEVDASGALNLWAKSRGSYTGLSVAEEDTEDWAVELETSDVVTTVSMVGDDRDPWGPIHDMVRNHTATVYGRREVVLSVDSTDRQDLLDAGEAELDARGGASLRVKVRWIEGRGPWQFGDVGVQDIVSVVLPTIFGGTQDMRCTETTLTLDPGKWAWVEHTFEALVQDITAGDPDA